MICFLHDGPAGATHICRECLEKRGLERLSVEVTASVHRVTWAFQVFDRPSKTTQVVTLTRGKTLHVKRDGYTVPLIEASDWAAWRPKPAHAPAEQPKTYSGDTLRPDLLKRISEW